MVTGRLLTAMPDDPLTVGDAAPDVGGHLVYPDESDAQADPVPLADLYADRPVLLNFYTADFSPDCMNEWCSFRDFDWFTVENDVRVVGASRSGTGLHRRFIDHLDLNFPLYSDGDLAMADAFGVKYRAFGVSSRAKRSCFLIDRDGVVRYRWLADHWLDPSRDVPPVDEIYEDVTSVLDEA